MAAFRESAAFFQLEDGHALTSHGHGLVPGLVTVSEVVASERV